MTGRRTDRRTTSSRLNILKTTYIRSPRWQQQGAEYSFTLHLILFPAAREHFQISYHMYCTQWRAEIKENLKVTAQICQKKTTTFSYLFIYQ